MSGGKNKRKNQARRAKRKRVHQPRKKQRTFKYSESGDTLFELKDNGDVLRVVWEKQSGDHRRRS